MGGGSDKEDEKFDSRGDASGTSLPSNAAPPTMVHVASTAAAKDEGNSAAQGINEVLIDGRFYDVSKLKHPGGTIINFFKGSGDATTAFKQFHLRSKKAP